MSQSAKLFFKKLRISYLSVARVLLLPGYILVAVAISLLMSGFILWSLNLDLLGFIFFDSPLSFAEKLRFFFDIYAGLYTTYSSVQSTGIVIFSTLFGINAALMTFTIINQGVRSVPKKSGIGGIFLAVLGGGCIACGTSIIAPILASVGATTSTAFLRGLSSVFIWLGICLVLYSLYRLGAVASYILAARK